MASQMADAQSEITTIKIVGDEVSDKSKYFICKGEVIKFKGFLEVDPIDSKNSDILPKVEENQKLNLDFIVARQKFKKPKGRYNEASLVKKLEELGIGRPSTYAPTISVIQKEVMLKRDTDGNKRKYLEFILKNGSLIESEKEENFGVEKRKLFPTDIGLVTNQFLMKHFSNIIDYNFTANVEQDFDNIANGKLEWSAMIKEFYFKFDPEIEKVTEFAEKFVGTRNLGIDPKSGKNVYVRIGRYGPMVQIGETDDEEKPKFTSLQKNQSIEDISLDEALNLFMFPKTIGQYESKEVVLGRGRFGPYIKFNNSFISIKDFDINSITLDECIDLIEQKKIFDKQKNIHVFDSEEPVIEVLNGRYGPYIKSSGKNYKIPKSIDPKKLSRIDCLDLISNSKKRKNKVIYFIMFSNYFNPVSKDVLKFKENSKPGTIGDSITIYTEGHFPDFQKSEVAIFGVNDYRGVLFEADFNLDMDAIRESFYALYVGNWNLRILDLGDLILGEDLSDTYFAISDLISNLISDGVVPIIIGGAGFMLPNI